MAKPIRSQGHDIFVDPLALELDLDSSTMQRRREPPDLGDCLRCPNPKLLRFANGTQHIGVGTIVPGVEDSAQFFVTGKEGIGLVDE